MKAERSRQLEDTATEVAANYSKRRDLNPTAEVFEVRKVKPLSETTAAVVYLKTATEKVVRRKLALAFFYWVPSGPQGKWLHMFISYNHLNSLERMRELLDTVEEYNHGQNQRKPTPEESETAQVRDQS